MPANLPKLHLKLRAILLEDMSREEAEAAMRRTVETGIPDPQLEVSWLDWRRGDGRGRGNHGTYHGDAGEHALVDFASAFASVPPDEIRVEVAEAAPPEIVEEEIERLPDRPAAAWGFRNYNAFLREARQRTGMSQREAQELYRQVKEATGRKRLVGADVKRLKNVIGYEADRVKMRSQLGRNTEMELTMTTRGETPKRAPARNKKGADDD